MLTPFMSISSQPANFFTAQAAGETGISDATVVGLQGVDDTEDVGRVRTEQGQDQSEPDGRQKDSVELSREAEEIRQFQSRDREVRAHEAAHAAKGGAYAGAPTYTTKRGPDGKTYVTGGEVSIDISAVKGDPQATLQKAEQVRSAALAPAQPSSQDMQVAQKAQAMAAKARTEISRQTSEKLTDAVGGGKNSADADTVSNGESVRSSDDSSTSSSNEPSGMARLSIYS